MTKLGKYSFGIGDRFGRQGEAQLRAIAKAAEDGIEITPVWNKSHREHTAVKTHPADVRTEADTAVKSRGWKGPYLVDADHINMDNAEQFIDSSDFFTLDVADFIGRPAGGGEIEAFVKKHADLAGALEIDGIGKPLEVGAERIASIAGKYLLAVRQAGRIYRLIRTKKGPGPFFVEVSMDETDQPQTPVEMLFILAAIADEQIPADTVAPKFSGRFNKGVDYVGDVSLFAAEFEQDLAVIAFSVKKFGLPAGLKLSVHSGSDKFAIYPAINAAMKKFGAGAHIKTAGTTWLEEVTGLAMAGGDGLETAKSIYTEAIGRFDELTAPYATVIDIDRSKLPSAVEIERYDGERFAAAVRHDRSCESYNPHLRQLLHVAYKVAAEMGQTYTSALERHAGIIGVNVTQNLYERHIKPIFG